MSDYITRVELHNEQASDYPKLHQQMELRNFGRTVLINGKNYHLPHATYISNGTHPSKTIYDLAQEAVTAIGRTGGIVVSAAAPGGIWCGGLKPV